jgi:hypothetical protein
MMMKKDLKIKKKKKRTPTQMIKSGSSSAMVISMNMK